jgi:hypothetical protein
MKKFFLSASLFASSVIGFCALRPALHDPQPSVPEAVIVEPGGSPADAKMAEGSPDQYAWELFAYLVRQAKPDIAGVADPAMLPFHEQDDTDGVWETWALASSVSPDAIDNKSEVFHYDGSRPAPWNQLNRSHGAQKFLSPGLTAIPASGQAGFAARVLIRQIPPDPDGGNQEIRINHPSFDTIVNRHLYSKQGVQTAIASAQQRREVRFVSFPDASKEIKAAWIRLQACDTDPDCADKARYHWRSLKFGATTQVWGLAALHIMTKDLNNWFWADFTHVDCELKAGACASYATGYMSQSSDSTPHAAKPKSDTYGTRWQNYHLRGTETGFLKNGQSAVLSNPVIETFSNPTSCMTCHAYASAGLDSAISTRIEQPDGPLPNAGSNPSVGLPSITSSYLPAGVSKPSTSLTKPLYLQADFEWAMTKSAQSETATHTPVVHHLVPPNHPKTLVASSSISNPAH